MLKKSPLRIAVLFGGQSGEHEVSIESAKSVLSAIDLKKYVVRTVGISKQGQWFWGAIPEDVQRKGFSPDGRRVVIIHDPKEPRFLALDGRPLEGNGVVDIIFPVVHGPYGEDGTMQGLLEMAGIPYVGSGVLGSALGMDKDRMKTVFARAGLPVAKYISFLRTEYMSNPDHMIEMIENRIGYPCFIKPANLGSSVGISKAHNRDELRQAIYTASIYDRKILAEENIKGREIEVGVLGNDKPLASIAGEILPAREFYDYQAKYNDQSSRLLIPAPLNSSIQKKLQEMAIEAFRAIEASGLSRVDFFVTDDEKIIINEINTMPGFTKISMYPKLFEFTGIPYSELIDQLINFGLERYKDNRNRKIEF